jgi:hypothetical protein
MMKVAVVAIIVILVALLAGCAGGEETRVTPVDESPPVISGVSVSDITETSATVTWTTDEPATSTVRWRPAPGSCNGPLDIRTRDESQLVTNHSITLTQAGLGPGLGPGLTYIYWVQSKDANGNEAKSEDRTFTTLGTAEVPEFPMF